MSEINENLEIEELSTEDKKKAINLQDLVYVKKYIDDRHYDKVETEEKLAEASAKSYTKEETDNKIAEASAEVSAKSYTKEETDETFYKKTDTVENANNAIKIYDQESKSFLNVRVVDEATYEASTKDSATIYFVKE